MMKFYDGVKQRPVTVTNAKGYVDAYFGKVFFPPAVRSHSSELCTKRSMLVESKRSLCPSIWAISPSQKWPVPMDPTNSPTSSCLWLFHPSPLPYAFPLSYKPIGLLHVQVLLQAWEWRRLLLRRSVFQSVVLFFRTKHCFLYFLSV